MQNKYDQNLLKNLWPLAYIQKITLENGQNLLIKRRKESGANLITLYAEEAVDGKVILGEASLFGQPDNPQFSIQIREEFRGRGLGKKFFKTIVALARTLGITTFSHPPIPLPPKKILEKWEQTKWIHLEYTANGQVRIHCQLNQKMGF